MKTTEQIVREKYPDVYVCHNTLFETVCIYEDFTFQNRISDRVKSVWQAWQSAADRIEQERSVKE